MDKKITIGLFIDTYFPMIDGVIMVVDNYAKRLANYANVIVFAPECYGQKYDDSKLNYKVIRCKSLKIPIIDYSLPIPKLDRKFLKEIRNVKLDIVHIHSPFMLGKLGINYAKKNKIPAIGTMHSQYKQDFIRAVKFKLFANLLTKIATKQYNRCDECWAVNKEVARIFYEEYGYKKLPEVMNNATDMKLIDNYDQAKELINKKHSIMPEEKVFLFVGRINKLKNVYFIVNSLKILKYKYNFKFKMLFVGEGQDEEGLKKAIINNDLEKDVIMVGKVTDRELLSSYYARADLFLFPSLYDASSIVQIEAASQKTPTLFIENAVTAADIENSKNGYTAEKDEEKFAKKIIEIMNDEILYKKVCENAYKEIYINWDDKVKSVYNAYLESIKKFLKN